MYLDFCQYKGVLLWFFDHIDSQGVCWYADAKKEGDWEWGMANEGLGRERQGEKTNRESKGSQEGSSYTAFAYSYSVNTVPSPPPPTALGFWLTVRCPVRKGVPTSKTALGITTSGEPDNQVIQCGEQTLKNSIPVYQTFALL